MSGRILKINFSLPPCFCQSCRGLQSRRNSILPAQYPPFFLFPTREVSFLTSPTDGCQIYFTFFKNIFTSANYSANTPETQHSLGQISASMAFSLMHVVREAQLQRLWSRARHSWVAEGSRRTELAFAPGQMQTHLSFSPAIPCAPVSAKVSKACDTVLLHRHSHTITSWRYMRQQCILYCFWVILPKKQNLKMSGSTEKIEVSGQTSVSPLEMADMLL